MNFPDVYAIDYMPYGAPYESWTTKWFNWLLSIPLQENPANDNSGKNCAQKQSGPVWFLAGTIGGSAKRTCTIGSNKSILFPVIAKECSFAEDTDLKTEEQLISRTKDAIDQVNSIEVVVDTVRLTDVKIFRVASKSCFDVTYPQNNLYGLKPGTTRSTYDGFWVFLAPLSVGYHSIYFRGEVTYSEGSVLAELARKYNILEDRTFRTEVIYNLNIV
jgi:hypothetical protein